MEWLLTVVATAVVGGMAVSLYSAITGAAASLAAIKTDIATARYIMQEAKVAAPEMLGRIPDELHLLRIETKDVLSTLRHIQLAMAKAGYPIEPPPAEWVNDQQRRKDGFGWGEPHD